MSGIPWSPEREDALRKLWADGLSVRRCAKRLGGFEHCADGGCSAVIGKVFRMKLATRDTSTRPKAHVTSAAFNRYGKGYSASVQASALDKAIFGADFKPLPSGKNYPEFQSESLPPVAEIVIPPHERKQLVDLEASDCRWPIGDPKEADFHFCGRGKVAGLPYCEPHAKRAFAPPQMPKEPAPAVHTHKQLEPA